MSLHSKQMVKILYALVDTYGENKEYLSDLDNKIGDGDHGINLARGYGAIRGKLQSATEDIDFNKLFKTVCGMTLLSTVGGASGPLLGTFYLEAAKKCEPVFEISDEKVVECFEAGLAGVMSRGKAVVGEKTMVDAMFPAVEMLKEKVATGSSLKEAFTAATLVAYAAAVKTADYAAQKGRASYLGDRSIGHQDPGAVSTSMLFDVFARTLE